MAERNPIMPAPNQPTTTEADVVPWPTPTGEVSTVRDEVYETQSAERPTGGVKEMVEDTVARVEDSIRAVQRNVTHSTRSLLESIGRFADERPLHFVAAVAGVAFAAGVAFRIWRSRDE